MAENANRELVAFAAFSDEAPHYVMQLCADNATQANNAARSAAAAGGVPAGEPRAASDWATFLRVNYSAPDSASAESAPLTTFNSTWLRYLLVSEEPHVGPAAVDRLLHALFATLTSVDHVLASSPLSVEPSSLLLDRFGAVNLDAGVARTASASVLAELDGVRLFSCSRASYLPALTLRRARIEDHDDLVPVFDAQSEVLTAIYGEFFLATLIQAQNEHQAALVAEVDGRARGLMGTTDQVDVRLLQRCFELEPYEQLRKQKSAAQEAEENAGPTPLSRIHNVFLTIASNSLAEKEKQAAAHASAMASKRGSVVLKRASFGAGALAALQGMLKSEAAAASSGSGTATPAVSSAADHKVVQATLVAPAAGASSLSPNTALRAIDYPATSTPAGESADGALHVTVESAAVAPRSSFPPQWLLNYIETYKPDQAAVAAAHNAREAREDERDRNGEDSQRDASEEKSAEEEQEEALLFNGATLHSKLQSVLTSLGSPSSLDATSFPDVIVSALAELDGVSIGGLVRFLELAVRVPANMPTRPPVPVLDASVDDGTACENVFCITLFCLDESYESRSIDVLKAAFDLFPDRNYCLLTLPHTSPPNSSLNLLHYFTLIPPTSANTFSHVLYLLHRDTLATLNELTVHSPVFPLVGAALAIESDAKVEAATESYLDRLWASIGPLVSHLPSASALRDEVSRGVRAKIEAASSGGGAAGRRIAAQAQKGALAPGQQPTGATLLAQKRALDMSLHAWSGSPTETLLVSCLGSVVGVVLFNRLSSAEVEALRADFAVEDFVALDELPKPDVPKANMPAINPHDPRAPLPPPREHLPASVHLNVLTLVINPLWNRQVPFVCRELLRLANAHVLHYQVWSKRVDPQTGARLPSVLDTLAPNGGLHASFNFSSGYIVPQLLDTFVQVRPRRRPAQLVGNKQSATKSAASTAAPIAPAPAPLPCALHVLTRRLISQAKSVLNSRLVLVGSSATALSFLETLLLHPDKHYSSITLLSKDGLAAGTAAAGDARTADGRSAHFLPSNLRFDQAWLDRLSISSRVRIVRNTLVDLNVAQRTCILADGAILPYDVLVLTPGLQNQLPLALIRQVAAQALADEIRNKELEKVRRETAARDARRRRKAQEQGLEDISGLDAEALARLDEEIEREEKREGKGRNNGGDDSSLDGGEGSELNGEGGEGDDDDNTSVASFDAKGRAIRRKKGGGGGGASGGNKKSAGLGLVGGRAHNDWRKWLDWSASGLEHWEAEYGALLAKQRALAEGTLDPRRALEENQRRREAAVQAEENGTPGADLDPSLLDLTPYGLSGLYSLSSEEHAQSIVDAIDREPALCSGGWLVNGASLEALTAIQGLLELGVAPHCITWAHPVAPNGANQRDTDDGVPALPTTLAFLNRQPAPVAPGVEVSPDADDDPMVLGRVLSILQRLGVTVLAGKMIKAVRQSEGRIYAVVLTDYLPPGTPIPRGAHALREMELSIVGVIGCGALDVDPYIFRSMHGSSLVYDGRLVLNHEFQTTVPSIYAAGPLAKFSRRYGSKVLQLERYSSAEVGKKLCEAVLRTALDVDGASGIEGRRAAALVAERVGPKAPEATKLPALGVVPSVTVARLPGNLVYFHASLPTHRPTVKPTVLSTQANGRHVRLEFNDANLLASFTLLAEPPSMASNTLEAESSSSGADSIVDDDVAQASLTNLCHNFVALMGMPASYMNRIQFRFNQGQIEDLVESETHTDTTAAAACKGCRDLSTHVSLLSLFLFLFLFSFLSGSWSSALYHESFNVLRSYLHYYLLERRFDMVAVLDRIIALISGGTGAATAGPTIAIHAPSGGDESEDVTASNGVDAASAASGGSAADPFLVSQLTSLLPQTVRDTVQRAALRFLRQHANHLPAYVIPKPFYPGPQAKPREVTQQ